METDDFVESLVLTDETVFLVKWTDITSKSEDRKITSLHGTYVRHPNVNVFCAVSDEKMYGPFFSIEQTVNIIQYLDMLQQWLLLQLGKDIFQ